MLPREPRVSRMAHAGLSPTAPRDDVNPRPALPFDISNARALTTPARPSD